MGFDFLLEKDTSQSAKNIMRPDSLLSVGRGENRVQRQNNTERARTQIAADKSQLVFQERANLTPKSLCSFMKPWRNTCPEMTADKKGHHLYPETGEWLLITATPETVPGNWFILRFRGWNQDQHHRCQPLAAETKGTQATVWQMKWASPKANTNL